ncbi:MAG TPA: hypothetical protein VKQ30_02650 [Ktedonobacterales bacterium]|nr:hypothetical protein [Ktedonobacterales bacterium]
MPFLALDYPSGYPIVPAALVRRERPLTRDSVVLVGIGDRVNPEQTVAEIPEAGGHGLPLLAGIAGRVTDVVPGRHITIEGPATIVHGIVGLGTPVVGPLAQLPRGESLAVVRIPAGAILVFPQPVPLMLLQRAAAGGVRGIIAPCMSARELEAFARADLSAVLDELAPEPSQLPLTILLTEGFGVVPMNPVTYAALSQRLGATALLAGSTNPQRNVRPEVLLSVPEGIPLTRVPANCALGIGARVRSVAGPLRGARGEIIHVYDRAQTGSGGVLADSATLRLESGIIEIVPLHTLVREG